MANNKKKKKLSTGKKVALGILCSLLTVILGFGIFIILKLSGMSLNSIKTVEKPHVDYSEATPEPGVEIIEGDSSNLDLTVDYDAPIDPKDIYEDPIYQEDPIDADVINILLLGDDGRTEADTGRTDSMMILSYNQKLNTVKIVSLLRDTWIYIPGRENWNRLNTAYRFGGIGLAINTINTNFDMDIQYYMLVHFDDITAITDSVGGIDLELDEREVEYLNAYSGSPNILEEGSGVRHLDGLQVFRHCRNRSLGNGDWTRTERQRAVMRAFYHRAAAEKDATALAALMYSLMSYVETNMKPWQMISLGQSIVFGPRTGEPQTAALPFKGTWSYAYEGKMAVIHIDIQKNRDALHEFLYGTAE